MLVTIKKHNNKSFLNLCLIPKHIFRSLDLSLDKKYKLKVGGLKEFVYIQPIDEISSSLYLSESSFNKLQLYSDYSINIYRRKQDVILGPVVGVFVNNRYLEYLKEQEPLLSCRKNFQANNKSNCILYYFSIDGINWFKNKIKGYYYSPELYKWTNKWFPMPNVVYDRGVNFLIEEKMLVKHIRKQFKNNPNINFINSKDYLDKWHTIERLFKYNEINDLIPATIKYEDFNDVKNMLDKFNFIFLKSFYGSGGREVFSIEKKDNAFVLTFYDRGLEQIKVQSLDEVSAKVEPFIHNKKFIIQQGIRLYKFKNRVFDMRILLEKDINGRWVAIYNQSRIAKENLTITNCSIGGDILNYSDIYNEEVKLNKTTLPTDEDIRSRTIDIAYLLDKEYGNFGELGMDMAIDVAGKIWFIEANTKPDKDPEPELEDTEGISPQCQAILEYSKFLAGMREVNNENGNYNR